MSEQVFHSVELPSGAVANTVIPRSVADEMYPAWTEPVEDGVYVGLRQEVDGISFHAFNSTLRFTDLGSGAVALASPRSVFVRAQEQVAISGNTVTRLCPIADGCGSCALAGSGLSIQQMSELNCARANTAMAFEAIGANKRGRFMLLPTSKETYVINNSHLSLEKNGRFMMQNRLPAAESVVITESWLWEEGMTEFSIGMNGADGSFGIATMVIDGERIFIPFCSMRGNMGDRGEEAQIVRRAINAYMDSVGIVTRADRRAIARDLTVSIIIGASATLRNFAHKIQIPEPGTKYYDELMGKYPELVEKAGGKITSAIVLNDQYPKALERGSIFPQFEAEMGIRTSPITPDNCPGDGQTCHVDYRSETKYSLRRQLEQMGVKKSNIIYDDSQAMDPADPANIMASNRAEQNNGVAVNKTNRTINGMFVRL